jgi:hypothetical protein
MWLSVLRRFNGNFFGREGGGLNDEVKLHLVKWDKVCSPIDEGGLGIQNVRRFNQALLGKWLWCFAHEEGAWWRSVLVAKYGSVWGGWRSGDIFGTHGVGLWKFICKGWQTFRSHFRFDLGEGSKICFWDDVWCGDRALKEAFLGLFIIASFKEASVADNGSSLMVLYNKISNFLGWSMIGR